MTRQVCIPEAAVFRSVPRDTPAKWLSKCSDKWQLVGDWRAYVDGVEWVVPDGYVTDLASIPRLVWWLFPRSYTPARHAALLHDWLYSHGWRYVSKRYADECLRDVMLEEGASRLVAGLFYHAVRLNWNGGGWG